ncbi:Putative efflux protein [Campylobacter jejuni subsp. jejuni ICDCCJ07004]|nr:Putative efflux protein [Campylobacter jejuni subsp. jejuni ICDCCJ07002]ENI12975.1 Putative efflux protein [Campylobacter jejuni subsp. jejuni ICDCCJ07004]
MLFGANALDFVICANINVRLVLKYESGKILAKALMIMFISTVILLVNAFFTQISCFLNLAFLQVSLCLVSSHPIPRL